MKYLAILLIFILEYSNAYLVDVAELRSEEYKIVEGIVYRRPIDCSDCEWNDNLILSIPQTQKRLEIGNEKRFWRFHR